MGRKCGSPEAPKDESDSSQPLRASVLHLHRPGFLCPCLRGVYHTVTWTQLRSLLWVGTDRTSWSLAKECLLLAQPGAWAGVTASPRGDPESHSPRERLFCWPDCPAGTGWVAPAPTSVMAPGWQACLAEFSQRWALCLNSVLPTWASESHHAGGRHHAVSGAWVWVSTCCSPACTSAPCPNVGVGTPADLVHCPPAPLGDRVEVGKGRPSPWPSHSGHRFRAGPSASTWGDAEESKVPGSPEGPLTWAGVQCIPVGAVGGALEEGGSPVSGLGWSRVSVGDWELEASIHPGTESRAKADAPAVCSGWGWVPPFPCAGGIVRVMSSWRLAGAAPRM